ncbi:hypothetical protein ACOME3_008334 [Neoechinorhynchus agilis]
MPLAIKVSSCAFNEIIRLAIETNCDILKVYKDIDREIRLIEDTSIRAINNFSMNFRPELVELERKIRLLDCSEVRLAMERVRYPKRGICYHREKKGSWVRIRSILFYHIHSVYVTN